MHSRDYPYFGKWCWRKQSYVSTSSNAHRSGWRMRICSRIRHLRVSNATVSSFTRTKFLCGLDKPERKRIREDMRLVLPWARVFHWRTWSVLSLDRWSPWNSLFKLAGEICSVTLQMFKMRTTMFTICQTYSCKNVLAAIFVRWWIVWK